MRRGDQIRAFHFPLALYQVRYQVRDQVQLTLIFREALRYGPQVHLNLLDMVWLTKRFFRYRMNCITLNVWHYANTFSAYLYSIFSKKGMTFIRMKNSFVN